MNKKIIFFILSYIHCTMIFSSQDNKTSESNRTLVAQVAATAGRTLADIFRSHSQETQTTTRLDNNCSWSCCCCCKFGNITSWFFSEREEDTPTSNDQRYQPHDPARAVITRVALDTEQKPKADGITEF